MPGAEVGAVDRVQAPVGLAAAAAEAVTRGRHRRAAFEAERAVVVDGEAALEDDGRVADAAGAVAGLVATRTQASAPTRTPQSGVKASFSVTGTLSRRLPAPSCSCRTPPSTSSQPGAESAAGVDTLGRYGTADGLVVGRRGWRATPPARGDRRAGSPRSAPRRRAAWSRVHRHRSAPPVEANDLNRCRDGASSPPGRLRSSTRWPARTRRAGSRRSRRRDTASPSANACALAL